MKEILAMFLFIAAVAIGSMYFEDFERNQKIKRALCTSAMHSAKTAADSLNALQGACKQ